MFLGSGDTTVSKERKILFSWNLSSYTENARIENSAEIMSKPTTKA